MLIEFGSVVGAVECALALQHLAGERNADVPSDRRMEWRRRSFVLWQDDIDQKPDVVEAFVGAARDAEPFVQNTANFDELVKIANNYFKFDLPNGEGLMTAILKKSGAGLQSVDQSVGAESERGLHVRHETDQRAIRLHHLDLRQGAVNDLAPRTTVVAVSAIVVSR